MTQMLLHETTSSWTEGAASQASPRSQQLTWGQAHGECWMRITWENCRPALRTRKEGNITSHICSMYWIFVMNLCFSSPWMNKTQCLMAANFTTKCFLLKKALTFCYGQNYVPPTWTMKPHSQCDCTRIRAFKQRVKVKLGQKGNTLIQ